MSTYLQLVQRLARECGVSGTISSVVNQTGEAKRLCDWVADSWRDIQATHQDWQWLRKTTSFATVAAKATYSPATDILLPDFGMWDRHTFRNYPTAVGNRGEIFMDYVDYETWRNSYQYGALRYTQSRPMQFAIAPDKSICLGPVPNSDYTVTADYYSAPVELVADADVPALPTQFHMAIVYNAMISYGMFEAAPEVLQRGQTEFTRIMSRVAVDRLPQIMFGGALA